MNKLGKERRQTMKKRLMKVGSVVVLSLIIALTSSAIASDNKWEIKPAPYGSDSYGTDVEMRQKYNYDPSSKYRGTIDNDGHTRMRDYNGNTLRGYIDSDGYGRLRDQDGNTYRVKPR
jgi:hypothetical protein